MKKKIKIYLVCFVCAVLSMINVSLSKVNINYKYDALNRLTKVEYSYEGHDIVIEYKYDKLGNRKTKEVTGVPIITKQFDETEFCAGSDIEVEFTVGSDINLNSSNTFTAHLSDKDGNFNNPVAIGFLKSTNSGTIDCQLPEDADYGTKYRIRVVSSSPSKTGIDNLQDLTINPAPSPSITGDESVCEESKHTYSTNTPDGVTNKWSVEGGNNLSESDGNSIEVEWGSNKTGKVTLTQTVTETGCSNSTSKEIEINPLPDATIVGEKSVCEDNYYKYSTNTSNSSISNSWEVTGGEITEGDNTETITVLWNTSGSGSIKLTRTNDDTGCKDESTIDITINSLPDPNITGNFKVCSQAEETYQSNSNSGTTDKWIVQGGKIIGSDISKKVKIQWGSQSSGTITLAQTIIETSCSKTVSETVQINPLPEPDISGDFDVCENSSHSYTSNNEDNKFSKEWSVTGGSIDGDNTGNSIKVDWGTSESGIIKLIQTNTETQCKNSKTFSVTIHDLPEPVINGNFTICEKNYETYSSENESGYENLWTVKSGGKIVGDDDKNKVKILWGESGKGEIKLTQTNTSTGCKGSTSQTITINPNPKPEIIDGNKTVCAESEETYKSNTSSSVTYKWYVDGGNIQGSNTDSEVDIKWGSSNSGTVTLEHTITSTGCSSSYSQIITINPLPEVVINGDFSVCENSSQSYTSNTDESGYDKKWKVSGGEIERNNTGNSIVVNWGDDGEGTLELEKTNSETGCSNSLTKEVTINPLPNPVISGTQTVCAESEEVYESNSTSEIADKWLVTGGKIQGSDISRKVKIEWGSQNSGTVTLVQTIIETNCSNTLSEKININPLPDPEITGKDEVCENTSHTYSSNNVNGYDKEWSIIEGDGKIDGDATGNSIKVDWGTSGTGIIKLVQTNTNTQCENSKTFSVIIHDLPEPEIDGNFDVCEKDYETYTSNNKEGFEKKWEVTGGEIQNSQTANKIEILWGDSGEGEIKLTQTNSETGCSNSNSETIIINPLPEPKITVGKEEVCANSIEAYKSNTSSDILYKWYVEGGNIQDSDTESEINIKWGTSESGTVTLAQTISETGCSKTISLPITIQPLPEPKINGDLTVCEYSSHTYTSKDDESKYSKKWYVTGGFIEGDNTGNNIKVNWGEFGNYEIKLIKTNKTTKCIDSISKDITINKLPYPEIAGETSVCEHNYSTYSSNNENGYSKSWSVEGGKIKDDKTADTIDVLWSDSGEGKITLTQKDSTTGCINSKSKSITINPLPKPIITGNDSVCAETAEFYESNSTDGINNKWFVSGGSIENDNTSKSITVIWDSTTSGTITLVQTYSETGCVDSSSKTITINSLPDPTFIGDTSVCEYNVYTYKLNTNAHDRTWNVTGGSIVKEDSTANSIKVIWGDNGKGSIELVKVNPTTGCSDSLTKDITINPIPEPQINGNNTVCPNIEELYLSESDSGFKNIWKVSSGTITEIDNENRIHVLWDNSSTTVSSGTVTLIQTNENTECVDSSSMEITINPLPKPNIFGDFLVCEYSSHTYTSFDNDNSYSKTWSVTEGSIEGSNTGNSIKVKWDDYGTGTLKLIKTNVITGCVDSTTKIIIVNKLPDPEITGDTSVCEHNYVTYSSNNIFGFGKLWTVKGGEIEGDSTDTAVKVLWGDSGQGEIKLTQTDSKTGCINSVSKTITINPLPEPQISGNSNVCTHNEYLYNTDLQEDLEYEWRVVNGSILDGSTSNTISVLWSDKSSGTVTLYLTNSTTGCSDSLSREILIDSLPKIYSIKGDLDVCENTSHTYSTANEFNFDKIWKVEGGRISNDSTDNSIEVVWGEEGLGSIEIVKINPQTKCKDSLSHDVTIHPKPNSEILGDTIICSTDIYSYVSKTNTSKYTWSVENGNIIAGKNSKIATVKWDSYFSIGKIELINESEFGCKDTSVISIEIIKNLQFVIRGETTACFNEELTYRVIDCNENHECRWDVVNGEFTQKGRTKANIKWNKDAEFGKVIVNRVNKKIECELSNTLTVRIINLKNTKIQGDKEVCLKSSHTYTADFNTNYDYEWQLEPTDLGTIEESNKNVAQITWKKVDSGKINIIITDNANICEDKASIEIYVHELPQVQIKGKETICQNSEVIYSSVNDHISYQWSVDESEGTIVGTNNEKDVKIRWKDVEDSKVELIATNEYGCMETVQFKVNVFVFDKISNIGATDVCEYETAIYNVPERKEVNNNWEVKNGEIIYSSKNQIIIAWSSQDGSINLIRNNELLGCTDIISFDIEVWKYPESKILGNEKLCSGELSSFNSENIASEYRWITNKGKIKEIGNRETQIKWTGDCFDEGKCLDTVKLICSNEIGCKDTSELPVEIYEKPNSKILGDFELCEDSEFTYTVEDGSSFSNSWTVIGGEVQSENNDSITVMWDNQGMYQIKLFQQNPSFNCSDSVTKEVQVHSVPYISLKGETRVCPDSVYEYDAGVEADIYEWNILSGGEIIEGNSTSEIHAKWYSSGILHLITRNLGNDCSDTVSSKIEVLDEYTVKVSNESGEIKDNTEEQLKNPVIFKFTLTPTPPKPIQINAKLYFDNTILKPKRNYSIKTDDIGNYVEIRLNFNQETNIDNINFVATQMNKNYSEIFLRDLNHDNYCFATIDGSFKLKFSQPGVTHNINKFNVDDDPFDNKIIVEIEAEEVGKKYLYLYNTKGQKYLTKTFDNLKLQYYIVINTSSYPSGVYIVVFKTASDIRREKTIIIK